MAGGGVKNEAEPKVAATESEEEESEGAKEEEHPKKEEKKDSEDEEKDDIVTPAKSVHEIDDVEQDEEQKQRDVDVAEKNAQEVLAKKEEDVGKPNDPVNPDQKETLLLPEEVESYWRVASLDQKSDHDEEVQTKTAVSHDIVDKGASVSEKTNENTNKTGDDKRQMGLKEMPAAVWSSRKDTDVKGQKVQKLLNSEEKNKGQAFKDSISVMQWVFFKD